MRIIDTIVDFGDRIFHGGNTPPVGSDAFDGQFVTGSVAGFEGTNEPAVMNFAIDAWRPDRHLERHGVWPQVKRLNGDVDIVLCGMAQVHAIDEPLRECYRHAERTINKKACQDYR